MKNSININKKILFIIFIILILAVLLISYFSLYLKGYTHYSGEDMPVIHSDGARYYSYIISYVILGDPTFQKHIEKLASDGRLRGFIKYEDTGNYLPKHTIGAAVMALPFFLIGYLLSMAFNFPLDGVSLLFQHSYGLAGLLYGFAGILLLIKILRRYYPPVIISFSVICILFGTNLFHYLTFDSGFSHSLSFFIFSAWLYSVIRWHEAKDKYGYSVLLGFILGLAILIRPTNIIIIIIFILYGISGFKDIKPGLKAFRNNIGPLLLSIFLAFLVFIPQLIVWKIGSGRWFINSYQDEKLFSFPPHIPEVLFSARAGLLFWSPIIILSIIGLWYMRRKNRELFLPFIFFNIVNLLIISSTTRWWYGGSFGHRGFVESYAFLIIPLAGLFSSVSGKKLNIFLYISASVLVIYSILQMMLYWKAKIPMDGVTIDLYVDKLIHIRDKLF